MNETEPNYITELRNHIDDKIENTEPRYFKEFKKDIKKHIDGSINELAVMIKDTVATKDDIQEIWANMVTKDDLKNFATKEDVKEILSHIGRYEIRAQNIEDIILQDHKPRIKDIEKEVFA